MELSGDYVYIICQEKENDAIGICLFNQGINECGTHISYSGTLHIVEVYKTIIDFAVSSWFMW